MFSLSRRVIRENDKIVDVEWEEIVKFIGFICDEDRSVRYSETGERDVRNQRLVGVVFFELM